LAIWSCDRGRGASRERSGRVPESRQNRFPAFRSTWAGCWPPWPRRSPAVGGSWRSATVTASSRARSTTCLRATARGSSKRRSGRPSPPATADPARPAACAPPANDDSSLLPRGLANAQAAAQTAVKTIPFQADYSAAPTSKAPCTRPPATARDAPATSGAGTGRRSAAGTLSPRCVVSADHFDDAVSTLIRPLPVLLDSVLTISVRGTRASSWLLGGSHRCAGPGPGGAAAW
jgi:hypothetical protein